MNTVTTVRALRAAVALGVDLPYWPPQYLRAKPRG